MTNQEFYGTKRKLSDQIIRNAVVESSKYASRDKDSRNKKN